MESSKLPDNDLNKSNDHFEGNNEELTKKQIFIRVIYGIVALLVIVSLIYVYGGFRQLFLFDTTSNKAEQPIIESLLNKETIDIDVNIVAIRNSNNGTKRSEGDIMSLLDKSSRIWNQADISIKIDELSYIHLTDNEMEEFLYYPYGFISDNENFQEDEIDIVLTNKLGGLNGVAFIGVNVIAVADITTTRDFRVLAHEFGHIFGLDHVPPRNRLMSQGATGVDLIEDEVIRARDKALSF